MFFQWCDIYFDISWILCRFSRTFEGFTNFEFISSLFFKGKCRIFAMPVFSGDVIFIFGLSEFFVDFYKFLWVFTNITIILYLFSKGIRRIKLSQCFSSGLIFTLTFLKLFQSWQLCVDEDTHGYCFIYKIITGRRGCIVWRDLDLYYFHIHKN